MMRGFINLQLVIFALVASAIGLYIWHCEKTKLDHAVFRSEVERAGKEAKAEADKREADDKKAKEKADEENKRMSDNVAALNLKLRNERAARSYVPAAAPGARRPDVAPFDRAELERAIQRLDGGVSGLIAEGDQARVGLDTARKWAQDTLK